MHTPAAQRRGLPTLPPPKQPERGETSGLAGDGARNHQLPPFSPHRTVAERIRERLSQVGLKVNKRVSEFQGLEGKEECGGAVIGTRI
jgi:hypothetical protein